MQIVKYLLSICLFLIIVQAFAQVTTIKFKNKTYSGDSLFVISQTDYISCNPDTLSRIKVDSTGNFECFINIKNTISINVPLEYFQLSFYIEPGKTYNILVPSKTKLSVADELNPYFEPLEVIPGIENSDSTELNSLISQFDEDYNKFLKKNFIKTYYTAKKSFADSAISLIEKKYMYSENPFFKTYLEYRLNMLRFMAYERETSFTIKDNFNNRKIQLYNPAYMDMFNMVFAHYFSVSVAKKWGVDLMDDIAKAKSPFSIKQTLKNNPAITNDTLIDLIILKGLNDAFYDNLRKEYKYFPRKQLLMTLDSMIIVSKTSELKNIAKNIMQKVNYMISGTNAPFFALLNQDSVRISLSELRGKYLYVNFTDLRSYSNANEMSMIKTISEKFVKVLDVVTICCNGSISKTREFCKENGYNWIFLTPENTNQIKNLYNVKAFPSYFLIDPYGRILLSPAPAPDSNFGGIFSKILNSRD